jgi:hypothetical protein
MIESLQELKHLLADTKLMTRPITQIPILDTSEQAFVIKTPVEEAFSDWQILRHLVPQTDRWPVIGLEDWVMPSQPGVSWQQTLEQEAKWIFNRDSYQFAQDGEGYNKQQIDASPRAICERGNTLNPDEVLQALIAEHDEDLDDWFDAEEEIYREIQETHALFGVAPKLAQVLQALEGERITPNRIQAFFFHWELDHANPEQWWRSPHPLDYWYQPSGPDTGIMLLPTPYSWETLAYMSFYPAEGAGRAEQSMAILRSWSQRFGADIMIHYDLGLQFFVQRKPTTPQEALQLSLEQYQVAAETFLLPGLSLRQNARQLLHFDRWELYGKP